MSVGRDSIRRAANAGAGKTVKKRKKQQKVLFILMRNCRYIFFKSYL